MKAQRRHELRENELAHAFMVARQYVQDHSSKIGLAAVVILGVLGAVTFAVRSRAAAIEDVWQRRSELQFTDPTEGRQALERLKLMTEGVSDRTFVLLSLMDQGREALRLAQEAPVPPDPALTRMAREAFDELLQRFSDNPVAVGVALSGLASVEENLFLLDGDMSHKDTAREYLTRIIEHPLLNGTPFQQLAVDRRKSLDAVFTRLELSYPTLPEETEETGEPVLDGTEIEVVPIEPPVDQ